MDFKNRLKGAVTQTLLKALLQDAGYQIIPLGIEEVIRELSALDVSQYLSLELPDVLRKMPDFLVADQSLENTWLVEVKYRKVWDEATRHRLGKDINSQVKIWSPIYLAVFLGTPTKENDTLPSSSIGVIKLEWHNNEIVHKWNPYAVLFDVEDADLTVTRWGDITWGNFSRFQDIFKNVKKQWENQTIIKAQSILNSLRGLDIFE